MTIDQDSTATAQIEGNYVTEFQLPDGSTAFALINVSQWGVSIAFREKPWDTWSAPYKAQKRA